LERSGAQREILCGKLGGDSNRVWRWLKNLVQPVRRPLRHLVAYGSTNKYRPVNRSKASGSSAIETPQAVYFPRPTATVLTTTPTVKAMDFGYRAAQLLVDRGADLTARAKLPGHYERPDETVVCTPLGYALLFPGDAVENKSVRLLRERGAME
jgi:hypothetical protein